MVDLIRFLLTLALGCGIATEIDAYSVLTHEAIIDAAWKDNIVPLLQKRFPDAVADDLRTAHAYAYGGAIMADMGYYPFGHKFISDLAHYVRSGDLILSLLDEATDLNEYAFALGSLAHYASDDNGHRIAVNKSVPIIYPKLKRKFGDTVTYADDKSSHLKVEFSFDVSQVAQGHYAPEAYRDFIGFEVAQKALERAFFKTYSLKLSDEMKENLAIGTFRYAVSSILPTMTQAAWRLKKKEILQAQPTADKRKFIFNMKRSAYRKKWGTSYEAPGFGARVLAFVVRILPKVGPLKALAFQPPTQATEALFMKSVNKALEQYRGLLAAHGRGALKLPNENFDTGFPIKPGTYTLADNCYAKLLDKLSGKPISPELRADILAYYSDPKAPIATKKDPKAWTKLLSELEALKATEASAGL